MSSSASSRMTSTTSSMVMRLLDPTSGSIVFDGVDIGDTDTLAEIGEEFGIDRAQVKRYLESTADIAEIYEENARAHRLGINGVPAFAFEGNMVISGAQEPEVLVRVLDAANAGQSAELSMSEAGA